MTTHKHIVQVHPVENGEVNLSKVRREKEFDSKDAADAWTEHYNDSRVFYVFNGIYSERVEAVYRGRVNCETGELE